MFPAQKHTLRKQFILQSMQVSSMNILRVWGGGLFEYDEFYEMADQYGIMLWHDQMFGCSEYPAQQWFFDLVQQEVQAQVVRLRHHPSILVWAGNNEDETAVGPHGWWPNVTSKGSFLLQLLL